MFSEERIIYVNSKAVSCEGENPKIGHPKIYMNMGEAIEATCPYCSMKFILENHNNEKNHS
ncbi:MAG: zinc-finger domain-containing protein [Sphingobacteriia bacterium]|nr:zinc-finger domain-containing protein [Sphingobacteriia bacterium]